MQKLLEEMVLFAAKAVALQYVGIALLSKPFSFSFIQFLSCFSQECLRIAARVLGLATAPVLVKIQTAVRPYGNVPSHEARKDTELR